MEVNKTGSPLEFIPVETEQSEPSFSIDVETAKSMSSGTCIVPSGSREFVICKEEEKIRIFRILRKEESTVKTVADECITQSEAEEVCLIAKSTLTEVQMDPSRGR